MAQKITLSLKEGNVKFAKRKARLKNTSVSQIVDKQLDLLKRIDEMFEKEKLDPWVKRFAGMVDTGKNEDPKNMF
jgi:Family of unknown function (DUF6364)